MPTLSSANRVQLAWKLEGNYPTNYGVLQPGNGTLVNMTAETLDFQVKTEKSKTIRSDRQTADLIPVGASATGGFPFEHTYKDLDGLLEGLYQNSYVVYGTAGVSAAIASLTLAAGSITAGAAPTGNDAFTVLKKGQWFTIEPPVAATQAVKDYFTSRAFRVSLTTAPTATVITLDAATPINTTIAGTSMAGGKIETSLLSNGTTMRSYSLEVGHLDIGTYRQYTGMVPSKMDLKLAAGNIVTGSLDFMGKTMNLSNTTGMGTPVAAQTYTPANAVRGVVDIYEGGTAISTTTYIKSLDIMFDNTMRAQEALGVFGNAGVGAGTIQAGGKMELYFADLTHYNKFLNNVESSLSVPVLDVAGNGYVYYFPRIKYNAAKVNAGGLDQDNMLSLDFTALVDITATSDTFGKSVVLYRVGA